MGALAVAVVVLVVVWTTMSGMVVTVAVIDLGFVVPVSYSADVLSGVVVGVLTDALTGVIMGVETSCSVEVLADVFKNAFEAMVTAPKFGTLTALTGLGCRAAFACWRLIGFDCARALQACMPSYHV